ncbi:MAG TPA: preprotein translocase subunit SecG [Rhodospirillaceae bacterium]|nr:preprotein translocase subunit SecG [Rhodospirillaceae bacterium]
MESVILVIHLFLALAIIGLVLLQRSEGGGLGIGGGGMGGFASARGAANVLSRATGICAFAFFGTSLLLGVLAGTHSRERQGILEGMEKKAAIEAPVADTEAGAKDEKKADEKPAATEEKSSEPAGEEIKVKKDGSITIPSAPIAE